MVPSRRRPASGPPSVSSERNATPTTTVGSTNGTVTNARTSPRPRNRRRYSTYAPGIPSASEIVVPSAACCSVWPTMRHVRGRLNTSTNPDRSGAPSVVKPRATSVAAGQPKKNPRNASGSPAATVHPATARADVVRRDDKPDGDGRVVVGPACAASAVVSR